MRRSYSLDVTQKSNDSTKFRYFSSENGYIPISMQT